jgi:hypothetical protein
MAGTSSSSVKLASSYLSSPPHVHRDQDVEVVLADVGVLVAHLLADRRLQLAAFLGALLRRGEVVLGVHGEHQRGR